jgi:hypothetical protein
MSKENTIIAKAFWLARNNSLLDRAPDRTLANFQQRLACPVLRSLVLVPSLKIFRMTGFHAALQQQNFGSCSMVNAASARRTKSTGPLWADLSVVRFFGTNGSLS